MPPLTWRVQCAGPPTHSWSLFTSTLDIQTSHNGPILCCTTPPPDEDCKWVSGPVLLGDVTGAELGNTVTLSHVLLCILLVPPSTRQCCLNTTLEWLLLPRYQSFAGYSSSPFQARNY